MAHWGWYWKVKEKHVGRKLCSQLPSIDSFKLLTSKQFHEFNVEPLRVRATLAGDHLKIRYRNNTHIAYTISIDRVPCNYGGYRYYFKCPLCQSRMRKLYFAQQSVILCRKCLNLGYQSQRLRSSKRYDYMAQKISTQIKDKGGDPASYRKPPKMWQRTYELLCTKLHYYQAMENYTANNELLKWYGPKIEPFLDAYYDEEPVKDWKMSGQH